MNPIPAEVAAPKSNENNHLAVKTLAQAATPKEVEKEVLEAMDHYFSRDKEALKRQIERLVKVIHKAQE